MRWIEREAREVRTIGILFAWFMIGFGANIVLMFVVSPSVGGALLILHLALVAVALGIFALFVVLRDMIDERG